MILIGRLGDEFNNNFRIIVATKISAVPRKQLKPLTQNSSPFLIKLHAPVRPRSPRQLPSTFRTKQFSLDECQETNLGAF